MVVFITLLFVFAIALVVVEFFRLPQPQIFFRMSCFQNEHDTPAGVLKRRSSYCPTLDGSEWEDEEAKDKQSLRYCLVVYMAILQSWPFSYRYYCEVLYFAG